MEYTVLSTRIDSRDDDELTMVVTLRRDVERATDAELMALWSAGDDAGRGEDAGVEGWSVIRDIDGGRSLASHDGHLYVVADQNGPWAVRVDATAEVWACAGVPESWPGYEDSWLLGDSLDCWCPREFEADADEVGRIAMDAALAAWRSHV